MKQLVFYLASLLILASCGQSYEEKQALSRKQRAELRREDSLALKIAVLPTLDCLPIFLANDHGIFDSLNVDVHIRQWNAQMDADTALLGGSIEGAVTDLIRAERIQRRGVALKYLTSTNCYWQLISNRTARIKQIKQLSDKMVAITRYSATSYLADIAIDSVKTKYDVYRIQVNDVNIRLRMLLNNEMDAVLLPEPQATTARLYGNPVLFDSRNRNLHLGVIAFRENAFRNDKRRKKQLLAFVSAYNSACDSINQKGLAYYKELIRKYCGSDDKTIQALPKMKFLHVTKPKKQDVETARKIYL
ncbi:MAG: ABC transporter substrate-binding protein [Prevotella sp.]|nr:ABC transporter substrate-binding protein [Prevotella sp.]MDY4038078.1 ABC transporter substrate-binding protein [Prevotella sp.]